MKDPARMNGVAHIVGAGLAGLSCAIKLAQAGRRVALYEAARMAGGRCRSYYDSTLDLTIDNGNHLLLSGNTAARDYTARIGAADALVGPEQCAFDFIDMRDGERWRLRPNASRLPWWIFVSSRRVPGTRPADYLGAARLLRAKEGATIGETMVCSGPLYERLWGPVLLSALNTEPREASATLAGAVLRETLAAGGAACRPMVAKDGLGPAFIDPALKELRKLGVDVRFGARLRGIDFAGDRAARLNFGEEFVDLGEADSLVLAVPPWSAAELIPGLVAPDEFRAILNAHFKVLAAARPAGAAWHGGLAQRMAVRLPRSPFGDDQRRGQADGGAGGKSRAAHLGRARRRHRPRAGIAAMADRQGETRDLRRDAQPTGAPSGREDAMAQSSARRRLDGDGPARDDRGIDPLRL